MRMKIKLRFKSARWTATVPCMKTIGAGHCCGTGITAAEAVSAAVKRTMSELARRAAEGIRTTLGSTQSPEEWAFSDVLAAMGGPFRVGQPDGTLEDWARNALFVVVDEKEEP